MKNYVSVAAEARHTDNWSLPACADCRVHTLHGFCPGVAASEALEACWRGERTIPAKTLLLREGDPIDEIIFLREGWAVNFRIRPDGRRQIVAIKLPGDPLNGQAIVAEKALDSAQTLTPIRVCIYRKQAFIDAMHADEAGRRNTLGMVSWALKSLQNTVVTLSAPNGVHAVGGLFLGLFGRLNRRGMVDGYSFACPLTQNDIADALGVTKVHVNRTLGILRDENLFRLKDQRAEILDYQGLCRRSAFSAHPSAIV